MGGLHPFKEARAQHFLVEVLRRRERIPMKLDLSKGAKEIEMCMGARYSTAYLQDVLVFSRISWSRRTKTRKSGDDGAPSTQNSRY